MADPVAAAIERHSFERDWNGHHSICKACQRGIEIAVLRGDLAKGGGEILLRTPPKYVVPNHSHTSDEVYVWLKGAFTYVAADGTRQKMTVPAYISFPGQSPHALECGDERCVFYLRYSRPFALHTHAMPTLK